MRIGIDLRMLGGGSGIDRYITELTQEILNKDKQNEYVLFFRTKEMSASYEKYNQKIVIADIAHYSLAEQLQFPGILKKQNLDLMHFPHFNVPLFYAQPFVVTIHDLTHTLFPGKKKSRFFHRLAYRAVFSNAIKRARKIIAVSESTKKQIMEYYSVSTEKIEVVYEGFNTMYKMIDKDQAFHAVAEKFGISKPFLLYVGVWRRYKNLPMLAQAFDKLKKLGLDFQLVLAGEMDKFYPEIEKQVYEIQHADDLKAVGRISDEDLKLLYNAATLFVLPSLIEGFGLTALEAAACGAPIACSDIPTLREIMGQGAEYFDPNNLENMVEVISELLKNETRLEEMANLALSRSKHFSWTQAATDTIKVYEEARS
ncbi:MAG TPA: glycosyltransferase family 1 protein [Methylomirabilota bacterium]|jgi:glycosyltransferase involved in cell wall biosynthesis|nr:glycosyltransferase family 1 protein [Methylomirabilota bacterium]